MHFVPPSQSHARRWPRLVLALLVAAAMLPVVAAAERYGSGGPGPGTFRPADAGPRALGLVGQAGGGMTDLAVRGRHAYVGYGLRLAVVDLIDPAQPELVGLSDMLPRHIGGLDEAGGIVVAALFDEGVGIFDVHNPAAPRLVARLQLPDEAWDVAVSGNVAYVAGGEAGLVVVDRGDPGEPRLRAVVDTPGSAHAVKLAGQHAFVAGTEGGLRVLDVADPGAPREVGALAPDMEGQEFEDVEVSGGYAYVIADSSLRIVDVRDPAAPRPVSTTRAGNGYLWNVAVSGQRAYAVDQDGLVLVYDVSTPETPSYQGYVPTPNLAWSVGFTADHLVITSAGGLETAPASGGEFEVPVVGMLDTEGLIGAVELVGRHAVTVSPHGLTVFDVAEPAAPARLARLPVSAWTLAVGGHYAYTGRPASQFGVPVTVTAVDLANPALPATVGEIEVDGDVSALAVTGTDLLVALGDEGLRVIDVRDPGHMTVTRSWSDTGVTAVVADGRRAFLSTYGGEILALDLSDPAAVGIAGRLDVAERGANALAIDGDRLYAGFGVATGSLRVIDVARPDALREVGAMDLPVGAAAIALAPGRAMVGTRWGGLWAVDVTDPTRPVAVGWSPLNAAAVVAEGGYAFAGGWVNGLYVVNLRSGLDIGVYLPFADRPLR